MKYLMSLFLMFATFGVVVNAIVGQWANVAGGLVVVALVGSALMYTESRDA